MTVCPSRSRFQILQACQWRANGFTSCPSPTLLELKLASGMTAAHRLKDLADILEVIRAVQLPESFADNLNPYRPGRLSLELWRAAQSAANDRE